MDTKLWALPDRTAVGELPEMSSQIHAEAFSPDGKWLATAHGDGAVRLWNVSTRKIRQLLGSHEGSANAVVFSPDSKLVLSGGSDKKVRIFETP